MAGNILWVVVFSSSDYMYGYYQQVGRACDVHRGILVITQQMWILHFCYSRHVSKTASCEVAATYCLCTACMLVQKQLHIAIKAAFWYQQIASYQQMASWRVKACHLEAIGARLRIEGICICAEQVVLGARYCLHRCLLGNCHLNC